MKLILLGLLLSSPVIVSEGKVLLNFNYLSLVARFKFDLRRDFDDSDLRIVYSMARLHDKWNSFMRF